jgi:hypothetical protein
VFHQGPGSTEQTPITTDNDRQIDHGSDVITGLHLPFLKVGERGKPILDGDLQTTIIEKVEQTRNDFFDPGVLSPTQQTNVCEGITHSAGAVIRSLISTAPPPVLSTRCDATRVSLSQYPIVTPQ